MRKNYEEMREEKFVILFPDAAGSADPDNNEAGIQRSCL